MIKCIALIKRRPGISHQDFVEYYERHHAPLAYTYLSSALYYARRYFEPSGLAHLSSQEGSGAADDFDCQTEIWFEDRAAMVSALSCLADREVADIIGADEERFIDRTSIRFFIVEQECKTVP